MKVVVTGICGYIGCVAAKKLLECGHEVVGVDKLFFPTGVDYIKSLGIPVIDADIREYDLSNIVGFDAVIHLAGLSNDPSAEYSPVGNDQMNRVATERFCEQSAKAGCKRFIFASSASVYGFNDKPKLDENEPINVQSYYAESKAKAEEYVNQYANDIGGVILRQGTIMGWSPRHRNDLVVNIMVKNAIETGKITVNAGGENFRPLLDIQDVTETYCRLLSAPSVDVVGSTFNIAHNRSDNAVIEGYTISCLALWIKYLLNAYGYDPDVVGNWDATEGRSYDITSQKLRDTLKWAPERGVSAAVDSIMEHRNELKHYDQNNIAWLKALEHGEKITKSTGGIF